MIIFQCIFKHVILFYGWKLLIWPKENNIYDPEKPLENIGFHHLP